MPSPRRRTPPAAPLSPRSGDLIRRLYFITHPNVKISADVPVPRWPLSERGLERMKLALRLPWVADLTSLYCSAEQKAIDGAEVLARHLGLPYQVVEDLGENDRSSTGFLPPDEFEHVADEFFANPHGSTRGWETADAAQARIVRAVRQIVAADRSDGSIGIVSHGAVGTLLYCHCAGKPITRLHDQPANGGGNYLSLPLSTLVPEHGWRPVDAPFA